MSISRELSKLRQKIAACVDLSSFSNPDNASIALNMITKNNEKTIKVALDSCHDVLDRMVIVDTGSTDATLEIIKSYKNVTLIEEPEFKGYSYHRNQAIEATNEDWIIVFDSDEYMSQHLRANLADLISTKFYSLIRMYSRWIDKVDVQGEQIDATFIAPCSKYKGRYNLRNRIFRNLPGIEFRGEVHEAIFGFEDKRIMNLPREYAIYHLDVAVNSIEERLAKTLKRNQLKPGTAYPEEYLPELFNFKYLEVPDEDKRVLGSIKYPALR